MTNYPFQKIHSITREHAWSQKGVAIFNYFHKSAGGKQEKDFGIDEESIDTCERRINAVSNNMNFMRRTDSS